MRARTMLALVAAAVVAALGALFAGGPGERQAAVAERPEGRRGAAEREVVPGRYIVTFRRSVEAPAAETAARERRDGFRARFVYRRALEGFSATLSDRQVDRLKADPEVAAVTADRIVKATAALASGDSVPEGVRRIGAAGTSTVPERSGANVAVIDTGVDLSHPDLNATSGKNCVSTSSPAQDDNGHGTHVAGTIAAENDGAGVVGVAPGTRLFSAKVLDAAGSGTLSQVICGIDWVTSTRSDADPGNDIAVANMSLGGTGTPVGTCATTTDPEHRAICASTAAGVTYVVAAGNDGWDFDYTPAPDTPAAYPEVLTVTAMGDSDGAPGGSGAAPTCRGGEADDRYASFSNFAATDAGESHAIGAPGVCVRSTARGGGHTTMSGTSMAAPHVAGAVALCLDQNGTKGPCDGLSPAGITDKLRTDAKAQAAADPRYGFTGDPDRPRPGDQFYPSYRYGYLDWAGPPPRDTTPPTAGSVAPSDGATAVAPTTTVSVTFSEPMDRAATEAAFALTRAGDTTAVPGSVSWSGNTMTFRPAAPLPEGTTYSARVSTGARDAAGNALGIDKAWSFKTLTTATAFPGSTAIEAGTRRGGDVSALRANDTAYFSINSTTGGTRTTSWRGHIAGVSNDLRSLTVTYRGRGSYTCSQTFSIWRWTTSSWVTLDSRSVSTSEVQVDKPVGGALADYVSGSSGDGEVRLRVRCTRGSNFFSSGDLMQARFTRP